MDFKFNVNVAAARDDDDDDDDVVVCFRREMAAGSGAAGRDLYEFLVDAELQHYYNGLRNDLKVTAAAAAGEPLL